MISVPENSNISELTVDSCSKTQNEQSTTHNPEELTTLGTQDTGRTKYNTQYRKLKKDEQLSTVSSLMVLFSGTLIISLNR
jgi:hypothetical protein